MSMTDEQFLKFKDWHDNLWNVPVSKFNIRNIISNYSSWGTKELLSDLKDIDCATAGCAIGYLPVFFPDDWYFDAEIHPTGYNQEPLVKGYARVLDTPGHEGIRPSFAHCAVYFGITISELLYIACPTHYWRGGPTSKDVSPRAVCSHMRDIAKVYNHTLLPIDFYA